jgi:hypothetical protein
VFARPHEEEEPDNYHLGHGEGLDVAMVNGKAGRMVDDLDRNGFHPGRRGVTLGVTAELTRYSEVGLAFGVVPWVRGPHARHGLRHRA